MNRLRFTISNNVLRNERWNILKNTTVRTCTTKEKVEMEDEPTIPINPLKDIFSATQQQAKGLVYKNTPFKVHLKTEKTYSWCSCGHSKSQPFCDGTHKNIFLKVNLRPIRFTVTKTKDYWLCNCKQTSNRPFCDGTHIGLEDEHKPLKP